MMNLLTVEVGEGVGVTATIVDPDTEELVDASTAKWDINRPDDQLVENEDSTEHPTTGVYIYRFIVSQRGTWGVRFRTTSPDTRAECHITGDWTVI